MADLEEMLRQASAAESWSQVIHRCAWCKRVFDADGVYSSVVLPNSRAVATDGMCPPCGIRARAQIQARHTALAA